MEDKIVNALLEDYVKVLCIDTKTGTFKEIKVDEDEKVKYNGINQWFIQTAISSTIPDEDKKDFLEHANLGTIIEELERTSETSFIYHRKTNDNEVKWMKMQCRYIDNDKILLTVRDVSMKSRPVKSFDKIDIAEEFKEFEASHASIGLAIIEFKAEETSQFYDIMKQFYEQCYSTIKYDSTHYIIYTLDKTRQEAFPLLAQLYQNLSSITVNIGYVWSDSDWNFNSLLAKAATNLQINK